MTRIDENNSATLVAPKQNRKRLYQDKNGEREKVNNSNHTPPRNSRGNNNNKFAKKVSAPNDTVEKQDWNKFKQEKKELKLKRKSTRDTYEITQEVKKIYEQLKCRRTANKDQLVGQMYNILNVGDTISKVAQAHDTARVLQCMLKHASPDLRAKLSDQLMVHAVDMCRSKYAHFCIERMLKYGSPETKSQLVDSLYGNIVRLAGHNIASKILDQIYLNGNEKQRRYMRQEFYGDLYKTAKDDTVHCLKDTYKNAANMKASIMGAVKANLDHIANKELIDSSLVHAIILEFMQATDEEKLEETVDSLAGLIPHMLTTKEGTEAAVLCFYNSTSKRRRAIIKNIKEHLLKIAMHEQGHVFLISLLNSLDDTKAIKKSIFDPLYGELKTLVAYQYGRRVVQWMVAPGDTSCFHPGFIKTIELGLKYGKKDKETRRQEILDQIQAPIALAIVEDPGFWLSSSHVGLVTADILKHLSDEHYEKAVAALAPVVADVDWHISVVPTEGGPQKKNKSKPHDVEAYVAEAIKERKNKNKRKVFVPPPVSSDEESHADEEHNELEQKQKEKKQEEEQEKNEQQVDQEENEEPMEEQEKEQEQEEHEENQGDEQEEEVEAEKDKEQEDGEENEEEDDEKNEEEDKEQEAEQKEDDNDDEEGTPAKKPRHAEAEQQQLALVRGIEDAGMHVVLKRIIRNDQSRPSTPFGTHLLKHLSIEGRKVWLSVNRACFLIVNIVEQSPALLNISRDLFNEEDLPKIIDNPQSVGAKILASKLMKS